MNKFVMIGFQQGFLEKSASIGDWWKGLTAPQKGFWVGAPIGGIGGYLLSPENYKLLGTMGGGLGGGLGGALIGKGIANLTPKKTKTKEEKESTPPKVGSKEFYTNAFGEERGTEIWKEKQKEYREKPKYIFSYKPKDITHFTSADPEIIPGLHRPELAKEQKLFKDMYIKYVSMARRSDYDPEELRKLYLEAIAATKRLEKDYGHTDYGRGSVKIFDSFADHLYRLYMKNKEIQDE